MNKPSNQQARRLRQVSAVALMVAVVAVIGVILAAVATGKAPTPGLNTTSVSGNIEPTSTSSTDLSQWTPEATKDSSGIEMVSVPSGCFMMGDTSLGLIPVVRTCFNSFWIDRYLVTNEQFDSLSGRASKASQWTGAKRPRESITWSEARDFCEKVRHARLPTEAEWEYAARGPNNRVYPWGDQFVASNAVYRGNSSFQTADVGVDQRPNGISWVGAYDMAGNVWEWTSTIHDSQKFPYPYNPNDGRESPIDTQANRALRGGSFNGTEDLLRSANRFGVAPDSQLNNIGFRCARS